MPNRFRVFHADDDEHDRWFVARAFQQLGDAVVLTQFEDGDALRAALQAMPPGDPRLPHLILTDLKMPQLTGIELTCWLRDSPFFCVPVIILTGSDMAGDIMASYRCGAKSIITKPHSFTQLYDAIGTVVKYWRDICRVHRHGECLPESGYHGGAI